MNKRILKLAIPNIISNITVPLLGMIDTGLMGHLESPVYIGAIGLGSTIFNIIYWLLAFLRIGTAGLTAQAFGKKDFTESALVLSRALLVAFLAGILIIIIRKPVANLAFSLIKGSSEVEFYARQYFYIRILASPVTIGLFVLSGWFIGMQNAKSPMYIAIVVNIVNIIFNFIFVLGFHMKSDGVAIGTLIAQYIGFIMALIILIRYYRKIIIRWTYKRMAELSEIYKFFKINIDVFIRMIAIVFVFTFFNFKSADFGDNILALNNVLLQFFFLFSFLADGFAYAAEALVGKYVGAKNLIYTKKAIRNLFYWGLGIAFILTLIYLPLGSFIVKLLTNNQEILDLAGQYLGYVWLIPLLSISAFIWDGIFIGATATKAMRNTMILSAFIIFLPLFYYLEKTYENHALWISFIIFLFSRGVFQTVIFKKAIYGKF